MTLRSLVEQGQCTPGCVAATSESGCTCACGGRFHGAAWASPVKQAGALPFSIDSESGATEYGNSYWLIGLPDGREVHLLADLVDSADGVLRAWSDGPVFLQDGKRVRRDEERHMMLLLGAGKWTHAYAASAISGDPVMITYLRPLPEGDPR